MRNAVGTVSITVGTRVWYVDNLVDAGNPSGGDGRSTNAFDNLAGAQAASLPGDIVFVFRGASGSIVFAAHLVMNPIIEVDPDGITAHGRWRLIMPCTVRDASGTPESRWLLSAYDEHYVRVGDEWKFASLTVDSQFYAAHLAGWAEQTGGT